MSPGRTNRFVEITLLCLAPVLAWVLQFGGAYGYQHLACASPAPPPVWTIPAAGALATVVVLLLLGWVLLSSGSWIDRTTPGDDQLRRFLASYIKLSAALAFIAIMYTGATLVFLPACASLR